MKFHTVYLAYEEGPNGRNYIGKHSTNNPYDEYLGSSKDPTFRPIGKIIIGVYRSAEAALAAEIQWQKVLDVVVDPSYANRSLQTSVGFDTTGYRFNLGYTRTMPKKKEEECRLISERMRENNPMKNPEVVAKAMSSRRSYSGSNNPKSKLAPAQREILRLMKGKFKIGVLATLFQVSSSTVKRAK
jgi:hypothetical protein